MPNELKIFDYGSGPVDAGEVRDSLASNGCVILRGLFSDDVMEAFNAHVDEFLKRPAIAGALGYSKFDHPKKIISPFLVGGSEPYTLTLDERVIEIIERYMDSTCILADASVKFDRGVGYEYFPLHTDFAVGWKKDSTMEAGLSDADMDLPVGCGAAVYLHDTTEGAFSYALGSHLLKAPHGQDIDTYPTDMRREIEDSVVRCDGRAGDFVLFDDRGFHGPDQPSRSDRLVVLLDYYRVGTFGRMQVTPHPVWTSDIRDLSDRQMQVLGFGARYIVPPAKFSKTRFKKNWLYPVLSWAVENAYFVDHVKQRVKQKIGHHR